MKGRSGLTEIALWPNIGGIHRRASERSMRLAMEGAIPMA